MKKVRVGVIGCGAISPSYLKNMKAFFSDLLEVAACADLNTDAARKRAEEFGVPKTCSVQELLQDPTIEIVVNLTNPEAHYPVTMAALAAGKHVFTEKPLGISMSEGRKIVAAAAAKKLTLAGAADTFLGGGLQLCRKLVDEGRIGKPLNATAYVGISVPSERYHRIGYGPMFDLSPYYITALLYLLGPVKNVAGMARIPFPEKEFNGQKFKVQTPTNIVGLMEFVSGPLAVITASNEVSGYLPRVEVFGTEGILVGNDSNGYHGKVTIRKESGDEVFEDTKGFNEPGRALGVAEMALSIRRERPPQAGAPMLFHVLDIMHSIHEASRTRRQVAVKSRWDRPEPFDFESLKRDAREMR